MTKPVLYDAHWQMWEDEEAERRALDRGDKLPTLSQCLTWLHMRTRTLEEIRAKLPNSEASKMAGAALTCGPGGRALCQMANDALDLDSQP